MIRNKNIILFIHGLASSSACAWECFNDLIQNDSMLSAFDTDFYSYPTMMIRLPFQRRSARIQELAHGLKTHIDNSCHYYTDITLVAHSMGGLIAKRYVITEVLDNHPLRIARLMLYAVPNNGAELANAATLMSWRHQQAAQLRPYSDIINEIGEQWARLNIKDKIKLKYLVGGLDTVVAPHSAIGSPGNPDTEMLIDKDHRSIIKPTHHNDLSYLVLRNFILGPSAYVHENYPTVEIPPSVTEHYTQARQTARALFDTYSPDVEPWYVVRRDDGIIRSNSQNMSLWVSGPTGIGKTASLKRVLDLIQPHYCYVILASHTHSDVTEMLRYISRKLDELLDNKVQSTSGFHTADLIDSIASTLSILCSRGSFHLFIEEIPYVSDTHFNTFVSAIYSLLLTLDSAHLANSVYLFLSSIVDATLHLRGISEKIYEKICFVQFLPWSNDDCRRLIDVITSAIEIQLDDNMKERVIEASKGSPRFIKLLFRKAVGKLHPNLTLLDLLPIVRAELSLRTDVR